jgi:hypothetical protein
MRSSRMSAFEGIGIGESLSEASEAGIFVISGEEVDGGKRLAILQPVCMECAKERNLDEIMSDIMSDIINDGLKGLCCSNSEPLL